MEYTALTTEHQQQMWRQTIAALEERHYALTMDRMMAQAITGSPEQVAARIRDLDTQIAALEQQHGRAVEMLEGATAKE